jgi:RNA polymerase-associated protein CTR9
MTSLVNGHSKRGNGISQLSSGGRFAHIPSVLDLPVYGEAEEAVEISLEELPDDPSELCGLLETEQLDTRFWLTIAFAYAKKHELEVAIEVLSRGLSAKVQHRADDRLTFLNALSWMYLWKAREAPRQNGRSCVTVAEQAVFRQSKYSKINQHTEDAKLAAELLGHQPDAKDDRTSEYYLKLATETINDASRISPRSHPLLLARGVLLLLRAHRTSGKVLHPVERTDSLKLALKSFDDASKASNGRSILAALGKARVLFSFGKYSEAYTAYQDILQRAPQMYEPDPRIGIGCCLWQLGHREEAKGAWERALKINPGSKIATMLMGIYWLHISSEHATSDPKFVEPYTRGIKEYTIKALKLDGSYPMTTATLAGHFLMTRDLAKAEKLAFKAVDLAEIDAIASDGFYLLAREAQQKDDLMSASRFYTNSDDLRGGAEAGYLPAKFGAAQLKVLQGDLEGAKADLEMQVQKFKCLESMALLGSLYAEEVFAAQDSKSTEDKSKEQQKAINYLEQVRMAWKDSKKKFTPSSSVLLDLARLYEHESPDKALQCLHQVEQMEIENLPDELRPTGVEDEAAVVAALREHIPPQLLNNIGCFYYKSDKFVQAREMFQTALNATVRIGENDNDSSNDTDALVTTISYNLGRTYEAEGMQEEAQKVYKGLLQRHPDYTDANARLAYMAYRRDPRHQGPDSIEAVYQKNKDNLEVRALYGLYLHRAKKRTMNVAEDQEQRFYKITLQQYDKHDVYSLTAMGNIYLSIAREMPREKDDERHRRRKMYEKAVEFFDKALQLEPRNAYAAQGIGIALAEDKKDFPSAIQIFSKVRETIKDATVFVNLGHVFTDTGQYSRAIENYEAALSRDPDHYNNILMFLGRVWLMRGKKEKSLTAMKTSLEYSQQALESNTSDLILRFNVAFVQYQIAQLIFTLPVQQRSLDELEHSANGLDEAIEAFRDIAKQSNPPYPPADIEQRANMGANTMKKQLERAIAEQKEYEEKNAERLRHAREAREAEVRKREEEKRKAEEQMEERRKRVIEERARMQERDRELAEQRAEEERKKDEEMMTTDTETGERKKREKRKRPAGDSRKKKKKDVTETDGEPSGAQTGEDDDGEAPRKKKKRRLERKSEKQSKYKSAEFIEDSDEDVGGEEPSATNGNVSTEPSVISSPAASDSHTPYNDEKEEAISRPRKKLVRVISDDEDEENEGGGVDVSMGDVIAESGGDSE